MLVGIHFFNHKVSLHKVIIGHTGKEFKVFYSVDCCRLDVSSLLYRRGMSCA